VPVAVRVRPSTVPWSAIDCLPESNSVTLPRIWKVPCPSGSPTVPGWAALAADAGADVAPGVAVTVTVGDDDPHPARHPTAPAVIPAMGAIRRQENVAFMPFSVSYVVFHERPLMWDVAYA
jgi:hypothetical protein